MSHDDRKCKRKKFIDVWEACVHKLKAKKAKIKYLRSKRIETEALYLEGVNANEKFENTQKIERGEFIDGPPFHSSSLTSRDVTVPIGLYAAATQIVNQQERSISQIVSNITFNHAKEIRTATFLAVVIYDMLSASYVYNIKTREFDVNPAGGFTDQYLFSKEVYIEPPSGSLVYNPTIQFTNDEMEDFINKQKELPGDIILYFAVGGNIIFFDDFLDLETKSFTVTYAAPK